MSLRVDPVPYEYTACIFSLMWCDYVINEFLPDVYPQPTTMQSDLITFSYFNSNSIHNCRLGVDIRQN